MAGEVIGAVWDPKKQAARERARVEKEARLCQGAVSRYGQDIAGAYLGYAHEIGLDSAEMKKNASRTFAQVIVRALNHGTEAEQVKALTAVLDAVSVVSNRIAEEDG